MHNMCRSEEIVSGTKPPASMARPILKAKAPMPWPTSKSTPRCARRDHRRLDRALPGDRRIGKGAEAMGKDIAGTQRLQHLLIGRRRMVDMGHQRQTGLFGDLQGDLERRDARIRR